MNGTETQGQGAPIPPTQDRKSTRLNSSHLVISYAVFCLKKKNRHQLRRAVLTAAGSPCTFQFGYPTHSHTAGLAMSAHNPPYWPRHPKPRLLHTSHRFS